MCGEILNALGESHINTLTAAQQLSVKEALLDYHEPARATLDYQGSIYQILLAELIDESFTNAANSPILSLMTVDDYHWEVLAEQVSIIEEFQYALIDPNSFSENSENWDFWSHAKDPIVMIRSGDIPYMNREYLEGVAEKYIQLSFTLPLFEKTLVDALIALELFAFGEEAMPQPTDIKALAAYQLSPFKKAGVFTGFLKSILTLSVILIILLAVLWNILPLMISEGTTIIIIVSLIYLFLLICAIDVFLLPLRAYDRHKDKNRWKNLLLTMRDVYSHMSLDKSVSAPFLLHLVKEATVKGVIWPSALLVILERSSNKSGLI